VVIGSGYAFFEQLTRSAKSDAAIQLASIGKLKAEQIRYYIERYERSAGSISRLLGQGGLTDWLGRGVSEMPAPWRESLREVMQNRGDDALLILDPGANIRFGVGQYTRLTAEGRRLALKAATEAIAVTSDIYPGDPAAPDQALLDIFVPIMSSDRVRAAGVLVLRSNLAYLYGLIQTWPVESRSAESVLVRKAGDHALFLNELRFRKQTALRMRVRLLRLKSRRRALRRMRFSADLCVAMSGVPEKTVILGENAGQVKGHEAPLLFQSKYVTV